MTGIIPVVTDQLLYLIPGAKSHTQIMLLENLQKLKFSVSFSYANYSKRRRLAGGDEGASSPEPEGEADRESGQS